MTRQNRIESILLRFDHMSDEQLGRLAPSQIEDYREALIANFEASLAGGIVRAVRRPAHERFGHAQAVLARN